MSVVNFPTPGSKGNPKKVEWDKCHKRLTRPTFYYDYNNDTCELQVLFSIMLTPEELDKFKGGRISDLNDVVVNYFESRLSEPT